MHVGHLRSTILGDSICRILEYLGNDVMRINHVGDWGTAFGMLIAYLEFINPDYTTNPEKSGNIRDLEEFYKNAKAKFDSEPEFKKKAQLKTVELQQGDENTRKAWQFICQISRDNFNEIYRRLDIKLKEVGESFYDPIARQLIPQLEEKKLIELDQGAKVFRIPGEKNPLMCVKSDGGLGYDTSDLAALKYRLLDLNRDWIIYVVGGEQEIHLRSIYKAGEICGWHKPPQTRLDHMKFGLVTGKDGKKLSTRKGGNVKLCDLLNQAWEDAKEEMKKRNEKNKAGMTEEYINEASEKLGYSAVKYYDLKQFREGNYKFDWDKMLDDKGNTAVYLFYSYVRICSVYRKNEIKDEDIAKLCQTEKIKITDDYEKKLMLHLLKFNDVIEDLLNGLAINLLCDFVYGIATKFAEFYEHCKITGNNSRILMIELARRLMKTSFDLLGMTPIEKI
ncbi:MAG: arginine--tRNA ligase [archaeon]|nr:arginine--tRNA ligase [archaeon]